MDIVVRIIQVISGVIGIIVGVGAIIGVFIAWRKRLTERLGLFTKTATMLSEHLEFFTRTATTLNSFLTKVMPSMLEGFEKKELVPKGTLREWASLTTENRFSVSSLRQLNEKGQKLLEESGMKKIIEDNVDNLLSRLEEEEVESPREVEMKSFYILKEIEDTKIATPIKDYLYDNLSEEINAIFLLGSIALRDKYLEKHSELLERQQSSKKSI